MGQMPEPKNSQLNLMRSRPLWGAMTIALLLGTVHAFSVLIEPIELRFAATRSEASIGYSLALLFITLGVLGGSKIHPFHEPRRLAVFVIALSAGGLVLFAFAPNLGIAWLGYSFLFGIGNGLGYGFALYIVSLAEPARRGKAIGFVTAAYALGAVITPYPFAHALQKWGWTGANLSLVLVMTLALPIVYSAFRHFVVNSSGAEDETPRPVDGKIIALLWIAYGSAVFAGLMVIGHAAPIAVTRGVSPAWTSAAPVLIAISNLAGSLVGGRFADGRFGKPSLIVLPLLGAVACLSLSLLPGLLILGATLLAVGFLYGAIIAAYPGIISRTFGVLRGSRVYGLVFTAWGVAGLVAPLAAGTLYDLSGNYEFALRIAALIAIGSAFTVWRFISSSSTGDI